MNATDNPARHTEYTPRRADPMAAHLSQNASARTTPGDSVLPRAQDHPKSASNRACAKTSSKTLRVHLLIATHKPSTPPALPPTANLCKAPVLLLESHRNTARTTPMPDLDHPYLHKLVRAMPTIAPPLDFSPTPSRQSQRQTGNSALRYKTPPIRKAHRHHPASASDTFRTAGESRRNTFQNCY